jgi:internalin A
MANYITPPKALALINQEKKEKTGVLNLNNCGLTEWPDELFELTWLKVLLIGDGFIWENRNIVWNYAKGGKSSKDIDNRLKDIDPRIKHLSNLTHLILNSNKIKQISNLDNNRNLVEINLWANNIERIENLEYLVKLTILDLSENDINKIGGLQSLKKLKSILLNWNQIDKIENLEYQIELEELFLCNNRITNIRNLDNLKSLKILDLSENRIQLIKNLKTQLNISTLNLSWNLIKEIQGLENLTNLSVLDLKRNQITKIENLEGLANLSELYLANNQIPEIKGLEGLGNLSILHLGSNQISEIKGLDGMANLTELDLSSNQLSEIKGLEGLANLSELYLGGNQIPEIKGLDGLGNLSELYLSFNQIPEIKGLDGLGNLSELNLEGNQISEIKGLEGLGNLSELDLNGNRISEIKGLVALANLSALNLNRNKIQKLGDLSLDLVKQLNILSLAENPLEDFTGEQSDLNNIEVIKGFLESLQQDTQISTPYLKLNILGDGRIGKTQFFNFLKGLSFKLNENETHGTNTLLYKIPGTAITAVVWDFGGQSYHHGFHQIFIRRKDANLVLWRNQKDQNPSYGYWLGTARAFSNYKDRSGRQPPLLCVQSCWAEDKIYYPAKNRLERHGISLPEVFHIDIKTLFIEYNQPEWANRNRYFIEELHRYLTAWAQTQKTSEKVVAIKEAVDQENARLQKEAKGTLPYLELAKFKAQFIPQKEQDRSAFILSYLEETGSILYIDEAEALKDYVFLNPPMVSDWLFTQVVSKEFKDNGNGTVSLASLKKNRIKTKEAGLFIALMQHFELIFRKPFQSETETAETQYIVPQFLPAYEHSFKKVMLRLLPFTFSLEFPDFVHEGRIFKFIARYGPYAEDDTAYWKYGLLYGHPLGKNRQKLQTLVYYGPGQRRLFVHIDDKKGRGEVARELFDYFVFEHEFPLPDEKTPPKLKHREKETQETIEEDPKNLHFREKPFERTPEALKSVVYLATKEETYINVAESMKNLAEGAPFSLCTKTKKRIKLDYMSQHLLSDSNQRPLRVFFSYSHKDEEYRDQLDVHFAMLRNRGLVETWHDRKIIPGEEWDDTIKQQLQEADLVLLMISADFLNSNYIMNEELKILRERHQRGENFDTIPIFTRECDTEGFEFMKYQGAQQDKQSEMPWIAAAINRDAVYTAIVKRVKLSMEKLGKS